MIGTAGGTLSANAPGAKVTLFLPAGSVPEMTEVTLTLVARLSGLPKGPRLLGGVQFSPENLALDKPATLTIEVSKPAGAVQALAWFDLGKAVSRYPSTRSGGAIQIRVAHFSGVAAAAGPASSWAQLRPRSPRSASGLSERSSQASRTRPRPTRSRHPRSRRPSPGSAKSSAWPREPVRRRAGKIRAALITAIRSAIDRAETRCKEGHDLTQVEGSSGWTASPSCGGSR